MGGEAMPELLVVIRKGPKMAKVSSSMGQVK
jgi:hypothetical protein